MARIVYTHLIDDCPWPESSENMRIRPLDVARAAATTMSAGAGLDLKRRLLRFCGVVLEVLAHLKGDWTGRSLRLVGVSSLDATAKAEVSQRIGAGLTRIVAERGPLKVVDFYNLDALAADPTAPVTVRRAPRRRRRPDFAAADAATRWSLLEAKGRTELGELMATRKAALAQVRGVDLIDRGLGTLIDPVARVSCVARLGPDDVTVFADDPPAGELRASYSVEADRLRFDYYEFVRQLLAIAGRPGPGLSGAVDYLAFGLPVGGLVIGVHKAVLRHLGDPEALDGIRAELRASYDEEQLEAEAAEDVGLAIGPDGLALAVRGDGFARLLEPG